MKQMSILILHLRQSQIRDSNLNWETLISKVIRQVNLSFCNNQIQKLSKKVQKFYKRFTFKTSCFAISLYADWHSTKYNVNFLAGLRSILSSRHSVVWYKTVNKKGNSIQHMRSEIGVFGPHSPLVWMLMSLLFYIFSRIYMLCLLC